MQDLDNSTQTMETLSRVEQHLKQQITELLQNGDEAQCCYSAQAAAKAKVTTASQALSENLYHSDPDVVIDSANALAQLNHQYFSQLEEVARRHPDGDARLCALTALSEHINQSEINALFCEFALGRQEDEWGLSSDWDEWWDIQLKAVEVLVTQPKPEHLALFLRVLEQDPEPELTSLLYRGIAQLDVNWIVDQLPQASMITKRKLVKSLCHSNQQLARAFLFKQLKSDDAELKKIAIAGLAQQNAKEYLWDIVQCLCDPTPSVQKQALAAIEQLNGRASLDKQRLFQFANQAPDTAKPAIVELLTPSARDLSASEIEWLLSNLNHPLHELAISSAELLTHVILKQEQETLLIEALISRAEKRSTPLLHRCQSIRLLRYCPLHHQYSLPLLRRIISSLDDSTTQNSADQDPSLRQACIELLAQTPLESHQRLFKTTLLGIEAYPDSIDIELVEPPLETTDNIKQQTLESILADYELPESEPSEKLEYATNTSTLGAITQANVEAMIVTNETPSSDDPSASIIEMVEEIDEELNSYANIVKANFDSADNLNLNRKKIARLPQSSNKTLAIRALGQGNNEADAELLIEALLGATSQELREIFQALTLLKTRVPELTTVDNGIGAAGNTVYHGDELSKQAAAHFLAHMPASKAIPLLVAGSADDNEHVKYCCLSALGTLFERGIRSKQRIGELRSVALKGLKDASGGVRRQALILLAKINQSQQNDDDIEKLIELAIDDNECNHIASRELNAFREPVLRYLSPRLTKLDQHRQPFALKLIGELL